jgi:hypothetical protein
MIDLFQFVNKEVEVTYRDGTKYSGYVLKYFVEDSCYPFLFHSTLYTASGNLDYDGKPLNKDIIAIKKLDNNIESNKEQKNIDENTINTEWTPDCG